MASGGAATGPIIPGWARGQAEGRTALDGSRTRRKAKAEQTAADGPGWRKAKEKPPWSGGGGWI